MYNVRLHWKPEAASRHNTVDGTRTICRMRTFGFECAERAQRPTDFSIWLHELRARIARNITNRLIRPVWCIAKQRVFKLFSTTVWDPSGARAHISVFQHTTHKVRLSEESAFVRECVCVFACVRWTCDAYNLDKMLHNVGRMRTEVCPRPRT